MSAIGNPKTFRYDVILGGQSLDTQRNAAYFKLEQPGQAFKLTYIVDSLDSSTSLAFQKSTYTSDVALSPFEDNYPTGFDSSFSTDDTASVNALGSVTKVFTGATTTTFLKLVNTGSRARVVISSTTPLIQL